MSAPVRTEMSRRVKKKVVRLEGAIELGTRCGRSSKIRLFTCCNKEVSLSFSR